VRHNLRWKPMSLESQKGSSYPNLRFAVSICATTRADGVFRMDNSWPPSPWMSKYSVSTCSWRIRAYAAIGV
jgi:hypothetical protein